MNKKLKSQAGVSALNMVVAAVIVLLIAVIVVMAVNNHLTSSIKTTTTSKAKTVDFPVKELGVHFTANRDDYTYYASGSDAVVFGSKALDSACGTQTGALGSLLRSKSDLPTNALVQSLGKVGDYNFYYHQPPSGQCKTAEPEQSKEAGVLRDDLKSLKAS